MTAPQQYSPDGRWWWDGTQWLPTGAPAQPRYGDPLPPAGTDGKAVAALVAGLVWVCGLGSVAAVVLGHLSRAQARRAGRAPSGLALAGLVVGYAGLALTALVTTVVVAHRHELVRGVDSSIELQSAADAEHSYHRTTGRYTTSLDDLRAHGYTDVDNHPDITVLRADATSFCVSGTVLGRAQYVDQDRSRPGTSPC